MKMYHYSYDNYSQSKIVLSTATVRRASGSDDGELKAYMVIGNITGPGFYYGGIYYDDGDYSISKKKAIKNFITGLRASINSYLSEIQTMNSVIKLAEAMS